MFILNHMTYYVSDDYAYRFVYKSSMPTQPLEKLMDLEVYLNLKYPTIIFGMADS